MRTGCSAYMIRGYNYKEKEAKYSKKEKSKID
jgi:hypothetical protein